MKKQTQSNPISAQKWASICNYHTQQITRYNSSLRNTLRKLSYSAIAKPPTLRYKCVWVFLANWAKNCAKNYKIYGTHHHFCASLYIEQ